MFSRLEKILSFVILVLIVVFWVILLKVYKSDGNKSEDLVKKLEYKTENGVGKIYESTKLSELKEENKALYDSIKKLKDVESGIVVKVKQVYKTDTIRVSDMKILRDTIFKFEQGTPIAVVDSVYRYKSESDTATIELEVKASDLKWVRSSISLSDNVMIINREKNGVNHTTVTHGSNTEIEGIDTWHRKAKKNFIKNSVFFGPSAGFGYGVLHNKFDVYIGISAGIKF